MARYLQGKQQGFTLIEVIVTMAIVVILASSAIPSKAPSFTRTYIKQNLILIEDYKPLIEAYYRGYLQFPRDNEALNLPLAELIVGKYMTRVDLIDGALHIELGNDINSNLHGKILTVRPIFVENSPMSPISWICGYDTYPEIMTAAGENLTDVDATYLPLICR